MTALKRNRWLVVAGALGALVIGGIVARLAWEWYQPWHQTYRVTSVDGERVCAGTVDLDAGDQSAEPRCFPLSLLPEGAGPEPGDCVRVRLEYESARITEATVVDCP